MINYFLSSLIMHITKKSPESIFEISEYAPIYTIVAPHTSIQYFDKKIRSQKIYQ